MIIRRRFRCHKSRVREKRKGDAKFLETKMTQKAKKQENKMALPGTCADKKR